MARENSFSTLAQGLQLKDVSDILEDGCKKGETPFATDKSEVDAYEEES